MNVLRLSAFFSALLFVSLVSVTAVAEEQPSIDEHLDDARSLYRAGHWQAAAEAFEEAYDEADDGTRLKAASALEWGTLLWEQGRYQRADDLVRESLDLARQLDLDDATGELLSTLGHIEASMGDLSGAENTLQACIQMTRELDDSIHESLCRLNRRTVRELQGEDPGSEEQFRADIQQLEEADTALSTGVSLTKTAQLYRDGGDLDQADQLLQRAGDIYRDVGNVPGRLRNQLRRAQLEHRRGDFEKARELVDGLLERFREMGMKPMVVHTLALHAEDAIRQGDAAQGVTHYREALSIAEEIDNPQLAGRVHLALCEMNFAESPGHCQKATETFESSRMRLLENRARSARGRTLQTRGEYEEARTVYHRAIDQLEQLIGTDEGPRARSLAFQQTNLCQVNAELGTTGGYGSCTDALEMLENFEDTDHHRPDLKAAAVHAAGRTATQADRPEDALEHFREAAELYLELGEPNHRVLAADILLRLGDVQRRVDGDRDRAPETFRRGVEILESDDIDRDQGDATQVYISLKTQLAQYHLNRDDWEPAVDELTSLVEAADEAGDTATAAWAYSGLANAYMATDRTDEALEALETGRPLAEEAGDEGLVETFEENLEKLSE